MSDPSSFSELANWDGSLGGLKQQLGTSSTGSTVDSVLSDTIESSQIPIRTHPSRVDDRERIPALSHSAMLQEASGSSRVTVPSIAWGIYAKRTQSFALVPATQNFHDRPSAPAEDLCTATSVPQTRDAFSCPNLQTEDVPAKYSRTDVPPSAPNRRIVSSHAVADYSAEVVPPSETAHEEETGKVHASLPIILSPRPTNPISVFTSLSNSAQDQYEDPPSPLTPVDLPKPATLSLGSERDGSPTPVSLPSLSPSDVHSARSSSQQSDGGHEPIDILQSIKNPTRLTFSHVFISSAPPRPSREHSVGHEFRSSGNDLATALSESFANNANGVPSTSKRKRVQVIEVDSDSDTEIEEEIRRKRRAYSHAKSSKGYGAGWKRKDLNNGKPGSTAVPGRVRIDAPVQDDYLPAFIRARDKFMRDASEPEFEPDADLDPRWGAQSGNEKTARREGEKVKRKYVRKAPYAPRKGKAKVMTNDALQLESSNAAPPPPLSSISDLAVSSDWDQETQLDWLLNVEHIDYTDCTFDELPSFCESRAIDALKTYYKENEKIGRGRVNWEKCSMLRELWEDEDREVVSANIHSVPGPSRDAELRPLTASRKPPSSAQVLSESRSQPTFLASLGPQRSGQEPSASHINAQDSSHPEDSHDLSGAHSVPFSATTVRSSTSPVRPDPNGGNATHVQHYSQLQPLSEDPFFFSSEHEEANVFPEDHHWNGHENESGIAPVTINPSLLGDRLDPRLEKADDIDAIRGFSPSPSPPPVAPSDASPIAESREIIVLTHNGVQVGWTRRVPARVRRKTVKALEAESESESGSDSSAIDEDGGYDGDGLSDNQGEVSTSVSAPLPPPPKRGRGRPRGSGRGRGRPRGSGRGIARGSDNGRQQYGFTGRGEFSNHERSADEVAFSTGNDLEGLDIPDDKRPFKQSNGLLRVPRNYSWPLADEANHCHQCRRSTFRQHMKCRALKNGNVCGMLYCVGCITKRYLDIAFDPYHTNFVCPRCMGNCNCTVCTRKRGEVYVGERTRQNNQTKSRVPNVQHSPNRNATHDSLRLRPTTTSTSDLGDERFWGVVYGLRGERLGTAFLGSSSTEAPAPKRRVFIGEPWPQWSLPATRWVDDDFGNSEENTVLGQGKDEQRADIPLQAGRRVYIGDKAVLFASSQSASLDDLNMIREREEAEARERLRSLSPLTEIESLTDLEELEDEAERRRAEIADMTEKEVELDSTSTVGNGFRLGLPAADVERAIKAALGAVSDTVA